MRRRSFLRGAAGAALLGAAGNSGCRRDESANQEEASSNGLAGRRFLTFNSVIRVNQIEVTRTRNEGFDEYDRHTPENVQALRQALAEGWPGAPIQLEGSPRYARTLRDATPACSGIPRPVRR